MTTEMILAIVLGGCIGGAMGILVEAFRRKDDINITTERCLKEYNELYEAQKQEYNNKLKMMREDYNKSIKNISDNYVAELRKVRRELNDNVFFDVEKFPAPDANLDDLFGGF